MEGELSVRERRSRAALVARWPYLAPVLDAPRVLEPVPADGTVTDLMLDGRRLYGEDARVLAGRQVAGFLANPQIIQQDRPNIVPEGSAVERALMAALEAEIIRLGIDLAPAPVPALCGEGFLVVLGIGLGHHLPLLLEQTPCRHLIVIEVEGEFLRQSLSALDWQALLERADALGRTVRVLVSANPAGLAQAVRAAFEADGVVRLEGSRMFLHQPVPALVTLASQLYVEAALAFAPRGWFEDQCLMLANSAANLARPSLSLVVPGGFPSRREPVFMVAAGPSLDQGLPALKRWREGAIVITCGTGLRACLCHGVVPDYHCETEDGAGVVDIVTEAAGVRSLASVTLLASATVDPRLPRLFGRTLFFFRSSLASNRLFAGPAFDIPDANPTATNAALALAACLGFRSITLFGVDCGVRPDGRKHARDTAYDVLTDLRDYEKTLTFPFPVEANFGGTVMSDQIFSLSREALGATIRRFGLTVGNCSDGARIEGASPCLPDTLRLPRPVIDRALVTATIARACRGHPTGGTLAGRPLASVGPDLEGGFARLAAALAEGEGADDLVALWQRAEALLIEEPPPCHGLMCLVAGTLRSFANIGSYFLWRTEDQSLRRFLFQAYLGHCLDQVEDMKRQALSLVGRQPAVIDPETPPRR